MYYLKKLTNFTKSSPSAEGSEESVADNPPSGDAPCSSESPADGSEWGKDGNGDAGSSGNVESHKTDSNSSALSNSNPSIPDCFYDDLSETTSSEGAGAVSSEDSPDTDSKDERRAISNVDVSGDKYGNVELVDGCEMEGSRATSAQVSSSDVLCGAVSDDSPKKPNRTENADEIVLRNENEVNNANGGEVAKGASREVPRSDVGEFLIDLSEVKDEPEVLKAEALRAQSRVAEEEVEMCLSRDGVHLNEDALTDETPAEEISEALDIPSQHSIAEGQLLGDDVDFYDEDDDELSSFVGEGRKASVADSVEEFLGRESNEAEARLAARRQARVEAREIRLRELERQQKEQEENADRAFDMSYVGDTVLRTGRVTPSATALTPRAMVTGNSYHSSRRSSEDSIEEGLSLRDIRHELKEAEEKFKKAMIANAQLDNEKSALAYQVELLKDRFEDLEETHTQLTREHRDKCREHEQLKRAALKLKEDLEYYKANLVERDRLIAEYGLVIVDANEDGEETPKRTLVSAQSAELLQQAGCGSLDVRLKKFAEERNELLDEIRHLKLELEDERSKRVSDSKSGSLTNGPLDEETSKILSDYKFKLQKAEQDVSTLQANVARLESQVIRYKTAAESSEKAEDELKIEKRKLQRENRESIARIEELETANSHLQRRMDKLKNAKSTLLKEL